VEDDAALHHLNHIELLPQTTTGLQTSPTGLKNSKGLFDVYLSFVSLRDNTVAQKASTVPYSDSLQP
jgi:hypothetical protein